MSGAERVRPNPPPKFLACEVFKKGVSVGIVVCSSDLTQLPFRKKESYRVEVLATGNYPVRKLASRAKHVSGISKVRNSEVGTRSPTRRALSRLPEETAGDKR